MESRLDVITLAVADLERGLSFYRSLGLESKGIIGTEWTDEVTGGMPDLLLWPALAIVVAGGVLLGFAERRARARKRSSDAGR